MCPALKQQLKLGYPSGYLDLTQAYNVVLQGRLQASDSEQARNTFLVTHWLMIPILADSILLLQKQQFCGKLLMVQHPYNWFFLDKFQSMLGCSGKLVLVLLVFKCDIFLTKKYNLKLKTSDKLTTVWEPLFLILFVGYFIILILAILH